MSSLETHKLTMKRYNDEDKTKKNVAFRASYMQNDNESQEEEDEEMVLLAKRFKKFMNSKRNSRRNYKRVKEELSKIEKQDASKRDLITYYECKNSVTS